VITFSSRLWYLALNSLFQVVMTKDQVEMDMRGRCSAGQKMLASIIIRLALSDSFGQNCGILALDEPTNALDTENIDALAASLVEFVVISRYSIFLCWMRLYYSIINERKTHSNFQLIIITHDENFLRKLGQANVMEYYWFVLMISPRWHLTGFDTGASREIHDRNPLSSDRGSDSHFFGRPYTHHMTPSFDIHCWSVSLKLALLLCRTTRWSYGSTILVSSCSQVPRSHNK
jgi:hypothetical protein